MTIKVYDNPQTHLADYGALVLRLRATDETVAALQRKQGRINAYMGNATHQALHGSIHDSAAAILHDPTIALQPFAVSTLFRWQLDMPFQGPVRGGDLLWLRFVGLHDYVMRELERYRRRNPRQIEIDRVPWQIQRVSWDDHLYAGQVDAVYRWQVHQQLPPPRLIRLRFLTPTYFKSKGIEPYLEPEPRLVFAENLLRRWENFYPPAAVPADFGGFVERYVHLKGCIGYARQTIMIKKAVTQTFTGDVIYCIDYPNQPDDWFLNCARFLGLMAEYATFAGVGKKTTMGLGMIDRVRILRRNSE